MVDQINLRLRKTMAHQTRSGEIPYKTIFWPFEKATGRRRRITMTISRIWVSSIKWMWSWFEREKITRGKRNEIHTILLLSQSRYKSQSPIAFEFQIDVYELKGALVPFQYRCFLYSVYWLNRRNTSDTTRQKAGKTNWNEILLKHQFNGIRSRIGLWHVEKFIWRIKDIIKEIRERSWWIKADTRTHTHIQMHSCKA